MPLLMDLAQKTAVNRERVLSPTLSRLSSFSHSMIDISFGENEILDMIVAPKAQIVKTLLRRLKYYKDQSADASDDDENDEGSKVPKDGFAVDQAINNSKSIYEKKGMRPN